MTQTATTNAVVFRDAEYGALVVETQREGLLVVNHGLVEASAIDKVLEDYATREPRDEGVTFWRARYGVHPAGVLSTIKREMQSQGYESDRLAERAIYSAPTEDVRNPDLPSGGRAPLVREAVDRGVRQQVALLSASLRESGADVSAPTISYYRRPNAQMSYGRTPPFAVSRFFVGSAKGSTALREAVLDALDPWRSYVVKASVSYMAEGQYAVEVGLALPHSVCEAFVNESVPTFSEAELSGARSIVFQLGSPLTEQERRDIEELGRSCTGCVGLTVEGNEVTAQVPGGFVGNYAADRAMNERLSWLAGVLEPWNPTVMDIGGLEEVNLAPEKRATALRELGEAIDHADCCGEGQDLASYRRSVTEERSEKEKLIDAITAFWERETEIAVSPAQVTHQRLAMQALGQKSVQQLHALARSLERRYFAKIIPESINEEEDGGYEVADHGLPPEVNTILTQFINVKQHLWDTPQMQGAVKKAKKLVKDKHGKEVADEFETKLDIARATACESVMTENHRSDPNLALDEIAWPGRREKRMELKDYDVVDVLGWTPARVSNPIPDWAAYGEEEWDEGPTIPERETNPHGLSSAALKDLRRFKWGSSSNRGNLSLNQAWNKLKKSTQRELVAKVAGKVTTKRLAFESEESADTPWDKAQLGRTLVKAAGTFKPSSSATLDGSDDSEEGTDRAPRDSKPKNADDGDGDDSDDKAKGDEEEKDGDEDDGKIEERFVSYPYYVNGSWPKDKAKLVARGMPKAVQAVADEAYQSAVRATEMANEEMHRMYGPGGKYADPSMIEDDIDYTSYVSVSWYGDDPAPHRQDDPNTWTVRNSLEDGPMSMRFYVDEGKWHYTGRYGKKPMPGGQREALSNAELMFHG